MLTTGKHDFGVIQDDNLPLSWPGLCIKWMRIQVLFETAP